MNCNINSDENNESNNLNSKYFDLINFNKYNIYFDKYQLSKQIKIIYFSILLEFLSFLFYKYSC
jgi:hypothetical protein